MLFFCLLPCLHCYVKHNQLLMRSVYVDVIQIKLEILCLVLQKGKTIRKKVVLKVEEQVNEHSG